MQELQTAEKRLLRSVKGCTGLDKIRNEAVRKELGVFSMTVRIIRHRETRLGLNMSKAQEALRYRHKEGEILVDHEEGGVIEAGTGHRPKP
jgi:transposase